VPVATCEHVQVVGSHALTVPPSEPTPNSIAAEPSRVGDATGRDAGEGLCFPHLRLPVLALFGELEQHPGGEEPRGLAEDNLVNRLLAIRQLESVGITSQWPATVASHSRQRNSDSSTSCSLDLEMPEMSGLEATAAIRRREQRTGTRIPIIAMTAHAMIGDRERCLAVGMDAYVSKPVQADELYAALENVTLKHSVDATQTGTVACLDY
jgi:CheY-like chemotaxis protein